MTLANACCGFLRRRRSHGQRIAERPRGLTAEWFISYELCMATAHRVISVVVDPDLARQLRLEAARHGKSVSRFAREALRERLRPTARPRGRTSALLKLCGLAHGELVIHDLDRELYGR